MVSVNIKGPFVCQGDRDHISVRVGERDPISVRVKEPSVCQGYSIFKSARGGGGPELFWRVPPTTIQLC